MSRLIDADALIDDIRKNSESYFADDFAREWVDRQPTIEPDRENGYRDGYKRGKRAGYKKARNAGRKKGKWTIDNSCPFCGFQPWYERDIHTLSYCPNCGADMREEGGE